MSDATTYNENMFTYLAHHDGDDLKDINGLRPFKCLVLVSQEVTDSWQHSVSEWLVASGCLYMMAWGRNCSSWDDSVDIANLEDFDFGDIPDDKFVVTTWHSDEPLEAVIRFAKFSAHHPTVDLEKLVVLDIGQSGREEMLLKLFDNA